MPVAEPGCPALWRQGLRKTGISLVPKKPMVRHWCAPELFSHPTCTCALTEFLTTPPLTTLAQSRWCWLNLPLADFHSSTLHGVVSRVINKCTVLIVLSPCVRVASVFCLFACHILLIIVKIKYIYVARPESQQVKLSFHHLLYRFWEYLLFWTDFRV